MLLQIFVRRDQLKSLLVIIGLSDEIIDKLGTFVPPMAKQFGIVRREHQWRTIHNSRGFVDLLDTRTQEMLSMASRSLLGFRGIVNLLLHGRAADAMVLDA